MYFRYEVLNKKAGVGRSYQNRLVLVNRLHLKILHLFRISMGDCKGHVIVHSAV